MTWTMAQIADEMARRRNAQSPLLQCMMDVRDRYNSDVVIPVPETDEDEGGIPLSSLAPLLIADGVDHPALYASQVPPNQFVPALDPGKSTGVRSIDYAMRRRKAINWVWDTSWWELTFGRFYRHLAAYGVSAILVDFDERVGRPRFAMRDPLSAYPEPKSAEDFTPPMNCGFIRAVSLDWLHRVYPETKERYPRGSGYAVPRNEPGEMWDVIEWVDEDEWVIGVLGPRTQYVSWATKDPQEYAFELERYPNLIGRCPAVIPRRVTLDRIISQLSNLTGHADLMAHLIHLDILATERSIFPDRFILAKTGQSPSLSAGHWLEGTTGETNIILDADAVGNLPSTPDPNNKATIDRLERNFRVSSGLIPQAGGETYGALRTGRGIDALMGAALDPRTTELHRVAERYMTQVNELILLAFAKRWPRKTFTVYSPLDPGATTFVPSEHVERAANGELFVENRVHYPIPGMDDINATQVIGQMMGAKLISRRTARILHPHVLDPEGDERQMLIEDLGTAQLQAIMTRAATPPGIPPEALSLIIKHVQDGLPLHEAELAVEKEMRERQAAEPPAPAPGQLAPPEAQPGLANPGEGAEMGGGGQVQAPPGELDNLRSLMRAFQAPPQEAANA